MFSYSDFWKSLYLRISLMKLYEAARRHRSRLSSDIITRVPGGYLFFIHTFYRRNEYFSSYDNMLPIS